MFWANFSSDCWIAFAVIFALMFKLSLIVCEVRSIPFRSCSSVFFNSLLYFLSIFASSAKALLKSKLSRLKQLNEKIQTAEQQTQNQAVQKKLTVLNIVLISIVAILIMAIFFAGYLNKSKYSEIQTLNNVIKEKQATVDHLNKSGGSLIISTCTNDNKNPRLCIQINKNAGEWQGGYMIPMGY